MLPELPLTMERVGVFWVLIRFEILHSLTFTSRKSLRLLEVSCRSAREERIKNEIDCTSTIFILKFQPLTMRNPFQSGSGYYLIAFSIREWSMHRCGMYPSTDRWLTPNYVFLLRNSLNNLTELCALKSNSSRITLWLNVTRASENRRLFEDNRISYQERWREWSETSHAANISLEYFALLWTRLVVFLWSKKCLRKKKNLLIRFVSISFITIFEI